jgi:signal transduction histidine kinase
MFRNLSIRLRLSGWYLVSVTLIYAIMTGVSWWAMRASLYGSIDNELDRRNVNLYNGLAADTVSTVPEMSKELEHTASNTWGGGLFQVFTGDGALVFQSAGLAQHGISTQAPRVLPGERWRRNVDSPTWPARLGAQVVTLGGKQWIFEQGEPLELAQTSLHSFASLLLLSAPLLIGLGTIASYGISRRALAPVDWIIRDARSINSRNLSERLSVPKSHDELRRLTETLNSMLDRIESSMRQIRQFTADASHELRSPITLIRAAAEYSLNRARTNEQLIEGMGRIARESEHTTQLINDLLLLARADAQVDLQVRTVTDLCSAVSDVLERTSPIAQNKQLKMRSQIPAVPLLVESGPDLVERLIFILVDNALKYTLPGGEVEVTVAEAQESAVLEVSDTGVGISAEDLPRIFDRFWRADKVRSRKEGGTGLGLSIAQKIVEQSGGTIRVESEAGRGSHFFVTMPCARRDKQVG